MTTPLAAFHPIVGGWFEEAFGEPTPVQSAAWPIVATGSHLLATAPTGSGKTLAAFLWSLDRLATGAWPLGATRVLYVSPLKALNNDVERNLVGPLAGIRDAFERAGEEPPSITVATRSGDTPTTERRRMIRRPPEILITTPESLAILLTSDSGRRLFQGLRSVILDEIHAVAATKRGTHLMASVERLAGFAGEFQRIALSATVRPLDLVARFVAGHEPTDRAPDGLRARPIEVVDAADEKTYAIEVDAPIPFDDVTPVEDPWRLTAAAIKDRVRDNRSTLVFTNSRRLAERVTKEVNDEESRDLAYSHHGSLARDVRTAVEERFKAGDLPAIVATSSLELGIDIGSLDEVVLVATPPSVASTLQRIGRAGHTVGATSRGRFLPIFERDLLHATVAAATALEGDIEPTRPVRAPLDVLAQTVLSMTAGTTWELDELFRCVRAAEPYRELPRRQFDLVIEMLAGRYADTRIRELTPRVVVDRAAGTITARRHVRRLLYSSGGTIPDRGYFTVRAHDGTARLGELDEEFVWERTVGDRFVLGNQTWRIVKITHNDVFVQPSRGQGAMAPFWRGEELDRRRHLSLKIGRFLQWIDAELDRPGATASGAVVAAIRERYPLTERAAKALVAFLQRQRSESGAPLPHVGHLLVERVRDPRARSDRQIVVLHTGWGGTLNRPWAMALAAAWEERFGHRIDVLHDDDCLMLEITDDLEPRELLGLVDPDRLVDLLRRRLEGSGYFGARFRENAGRALLLPRGDHRHRVPLWLNRERAKKLLDGIEPHGDFPMLLETWRTCLQDELEIDALRERLVAVELGEIEVSDVVTSSPSPFAAHLTWKQTNRLMYEDDAAESDGHPTRLAGELIDEVVRDRRLRPLVPVSVIERFRAKLHRIETGYAPQPGAELVAWVEERVALSRSEWAELESAVRRDHPDHPAEDPIANPQVLVIEDDEMLVTTWSTLPRLASAREIRPEDLTVRPIEGGPDAALPRYPDRSTSATELAAEWLRHHGPVAPERLAWLLDLDELALEQLMDDLAGDDLVVVDRLTESAEKREICDAENLGRLLRLARAEARPDLPTRPIGELPSFLAWHQGLARRRDGADGLRSALDALLGFPAPADAWERELLPARLSPYYHHWLDSLLAETDLCWIGTGDRRLTFAFASDVELLGDEPDPATDDLASVLPEGPGRFDLVELGRVTGLDPANLTERLWAEAWAGSATNDGFAAVRKGIQTDFAPSDAVPEGRHRSRRRTSQRWAASRAYVGHWYRLPTVDSEDDPIERLELEKDRARLVLDRYGVVFRELLARELPSLRWGRLFRALRLMELAGEVVTGRFFDGIPGLQFAATRVVRRLREGWPHDHVWWTVATDPASPCGLGLDGLPNELPRRVPTSHVVWRGTELALVSNASGRRLTIAAAPDDPRLPELFDVLRSQLTRPFDPRSSITVDLVNGEPAAASPYAAALGRLFHATSAGDSLRLWRSY